MSKSRAKLRKNWFLFIYRNLIFHRQKRDVITWSYNLHGCQPPVSRTHLSWWFLFFCLVLDGPATKIKETGACKASWDISLLLCQELGVALELYSVTLPLLSVISRPSNLHCFHLQPWLWHRCLASFRFLGGGFQILLFGVLIKSERPGDPSMWELLLLTAVVSWF